jgi:hypothetical protein
MSTDRIAALEQRLTRLERERRISAGLLAAGLVLLVASQTSRPQAQAGAAPATVKAPFTVVNDQGQPIFSITRAGAETKLEMIDGGTAVAGLSASKDASVLFLGDSKAFARVGMNFGGPDTGPSIALKDSGGELFTVGTEAVSINAPMKVSPGEFPDKDALSVSGTVSMRDAKGRRGTTLGDTGLRVHGADGVAVAASLGVDDARKGRLVVGLPTGPHGVIAQPSAGGVSFSLSDGPGKDYRIGMLAVPGDVAFLRMNTGKQQVTLITDTTSGAVNVFNANGNAAASLSSTTNGNGQLELGDAAGNTTVEAGTTGDGLGVVRAGPRMGGAVGFAGSLPWAILGKAAK